MLKVGITDYTCSACTAQGWWLA